MGEHCQIGVVSGTEVVYVDSVRGARAASLQFEPGERVPIHCTSTGKLFLAELDDAGLSRFLGHRPLPRYTPSTVTEPATLLVPVREVRRRGWAATDGEYVAGVVGCAVPIRGRNNAMLASLAVAIRGAHAVRCGAPVRSGIARHGEGDRGDDRSGSRGDVTGGRDRRSRRLPSVSPAIVTSASGETCSGAAAPGPAALSPIWWPGQDMPGSRAAAS